MLYPSKKEKKVKKSVNKTATLIVYIKKTAAATAATVIIFQPGDYFQPKADAPRTAASAPERLD